MRAAHIYAMGLGQYRTSFRCANSFIPNTPYVISVHQTAGLPPASSRFRLTTDTLAIGLQFLLPSL